MRCRECNTDRLVHDDVGSLVCTNCGTLADPAQVILADRGEPPSISQSVLRNSRGWHLAQTKQDRDRKNTIAMCTFIHSVLSRLNNPGLSPRAEAIFTQAMAKGHYRWGRRAKLTAGASIAIALREAHKSDSLRDIAFFLDDSPVSLARAFQSVVSLLDFSLASTDPAVHLPILHAFLQSIILPHTLSPSQLPKSLISVLTTISLQAAVHTATSLSQIISHHSPPLALANLPTPPTACALLILGLEAETRAPLPHLGELARTLAARFALSPSVVSSRYKFLYDLIEEWIRHVPWLDQFVYKGKGRGAVARSKVPKRSIVAKGIKDVIQFHEEIWLSCLQSQQKVKLDLQLDPGDFADQEEEEDQGDNDGVNTPTIASSSTSVKESVIVPLPTSRHGFEKKDKAMQVTYQSFLDSLSFGSLDAAMSNGDFSLLTHLLTCSPDELSRARGTPPTRLQLLVASRGGSTADKIADEELFADGELEGLLRSEQEQEALRPLFQLNWGEEMSTDGAVVCHGKPVTTETKRGAQRVNMDALTRLLGGYIDGDSRSEEDVTRFPYPDNDGYLRGWDGHLLCSSEGQTMENEELVDDWRPAYLADGRDEFGDFHYTADDRYEEEL